MEIARLRLLPPRCVEWRGQAVQLSQQRFALLGAMLARPMQTLRYGEVRTALDAPAISRNHIAALLHGLKAQLRAIGCGLRYENVHDQGYRFIGFEEVAHDAC